MNIIVYIGLIVLAVFIAIFVVGIIAGAMNSRKRFLSHAINLFNQLSKNEQEVLKEVWRAFKFNDAEKANNTIFSLGSDELLNIKETLKPENRPADLSAGRMMDITTWNAYLKEAENKGLNKNAAEIVAGIGLHGVEKIF